jgi:hypothetical protein
MTAHQSYEDASQGSPNLEALQYLQENWGRTEIGAASRVAKTSVISGSAGIAVDIPTGAKIIDAHVICTASNGSGSMTIKTAGGTSISDAMACTTADAIARATTLDTTYTTVDADGIEIVANDDADSGDVYIHYMK